MGVELCEAWLAAVVEDEDGVDHGACGGGDVLLVVKEIPYYALDSSTRKLV